MQTEKLDLGGYEVEEAVRSWDRICRDMGKYAQGLYYFQT